MHLVDHAIIAVYFVAMIGVGLYFLRRQGDIASYFVGGRKMGAGHVGLSVVATDVGGGFSIGLGGLGFTMGLAGSWLLFTGLLGAWISAVVLVPRVKTLGDARGWLTYPQFLEHRFDGKTRALAAVVSAIGYAAFVGGQILAGAKLASVAFEIDLTFAVLGMAVVVIAYTAFGGLEAVVYTDTIQWVVLLGGLALFGVPFALAEVGGFGALAEALPAGHLDLFNLSWGTFFTWMITIVPIWFVANTLYQRIYATRDVKSAKRAWYIAGLLEWPILAMLATLLGVLSRVLFPNLGADQAELGLPMLIKDVLPIGVVGIMMAVYFSAVMSTADSCLLASVGHFVSDVYQKYVKPDAEMADVLRLSRMLTFVVGVASISVALMLPKVLDAIMLAYSFMVSGLFVPTLAGLLWKRTSATAAFSSMMVGGTLAVVLAAVPDAYLGPVGELEPIFIALPASAVVLVALTLALPPTAPTALADARAE